MRRIAPLKLAEMTAGGTWKQCAAQLGIPDGPATRSVHMLRSQIGDSGLWEFEGHYNHHRPHRSRSLHPPVHDPGEAIDMTAPINRRTTVSGLINEYRRAA
jgi:hypothetical protein